MRKTNLNSNILYNMLSYYINFPKVFEPNIIHHKKYILN